MQKIIWVLIIALASCNLRGKAKIVKSKGECVYESNDSTSELSFQYNKQICKNGSEDLILKDSNYNINLFQFDTGTYRYLLAFTIVKNGFTEVITLDSFGQPVKMFHKIGEAKNGPITIFSSSGHIESFHDIYFGLQYGGNCEYYKDGIRKTYKYFGDGPDNEDGAITKIEFDSSGRIDKFNGKVIASPIFILKTKGKIRVNTIAVPYSRVKLTVIKNEKDVLTTMDHEVLLDWDTTAKYVFKATYSDLIDKGFTRSEIRTFPSN